MIPRLKEICHDLPPTDRRILNLELKQICKENNLPEISNHSLRISFCSLCYLKGIPEKICMKIGGWKTLSVMHEVYVRISEDDVDRYAEILEDVFR
jgi:integrase